LCYYLIAHQNIVFPERQLVYLRGNATFTCNSSETRKWRKDGKPVQQNHITPQSAVYIYKVQATDSGVYTCIVHDKKLNSFVTKGYGELIIGGMNVAYY